MSLVHRSLKMDEALWAELQQKAKKRGCSTNSYVRWLIEADLRDNSEEMEERLVTTISQLSARVQSIGTMSQAAFATQWALIELVLNGLPGARTGSMPGSEDRIRDVRRRIAGDVRGNKMLAEFTD